MLFFVTWQLWLCIAVVGISPPTWHCLHSTPLRKAGIFTTLLLLLLFMFTPQLYFKTLWMLFLRVPIKQKNVKQSDADQNKLSIISSREAFASVRTKLSVLVSLSPFRWFDDKVKRRKGKEEEEEERNFFEKETDNYHLLLPPFKSVRVKKRERERKTEPGQFLTPTKEEENSTIFTTVDTPPP